jgi:ADP-ribosylglycohydrolase
MTGKMGRDTGGSAEEDAMEAGSHQDLITGVLYGQAIGDALGIPAEFKSSTLLRAKYRGEGPREFEATSRTRHGWAAGEWSDDTEQALCILDAWNKDGGDLVPSTLASEFCRWAETNGKGMGNHTWNVLSSGATYLLDPIAISREIWEKSGKRAAANGAVMRTSVVGILDPEDLDRTEELAVLAARTTHYDPRCVASAVAISTAIATVVTTNDLDRALKVAVERGSRYHDEVPRYANMSLNELALDEGLDEPSKGWTRAPIGYTYKCLGAGLWALREFRRRADHDDLYEDRFLDILGTVIRAGGDTDTNGAVAGAVMGAEVGASNLPDHLVKGLHQRSELDRRLAPILGR